MYHNLGNMNFKLSNMGIKGVSHILCSKTIFNALVTHPNYRDSSRDQYQLLRAYGIEGEITKMIFEHVIVSIGNVDDEDVIDFYVADAEKFSMRVEY